MIRSTRTSRPRYLAIGLVALATTAHAEIEFDGTVGPLGSLFGDMVIHDSMGTQAGENLFHSFSVFNVQSGESALFTSSYAGPTSNVIGRVTGWSFSTIDGSLGCDIAGADLWLVNPNGVTFGQNASLDVQGSLHVSTADYLEFEDGVQFEAGPGFRGTPTLTMENPVAFGFMGPAPAPIVVNESILEMSPGETLSLVGGDIGITGGPLGIIDAPGGRINLVSVAGAGEAVFRGEIIGVDGFDAMGEISITDLGWLSVSETIGAGEGSVYIRGGRFFMDSSAILANSLDRDGGSVDIAATGDVVLDSGSWISAATYGIGDGSAIRIEAGGDAVALNGTLVETLTEGPGNAGSITFTGGNVYVAIASMISSASRAFAAGKAGNIAVTAAGEVGIIGIPGFLTGIRSVTEDFAAGDAGDVTVTAGSIAIVGGPADFGTGIWSNSFQSFGNAGDLTINTDTLFMAGGTINSETLAALGTAGNVDITATRVELNGEALVSTSSRGFGAGGVLTIVADESVAVGGGSSVQSTASFSGDGGSISITTPDLLVEESFIQTAAFRDGSAGDIEITVGHLTLESGFITSDAAFTGDLDNPIPSTGAAGNIAITATEGITATNVGGTELSRSRISSSTFGEADAGIITIVAPQITLDDSAIDTATFLASGNAGTIDIDVGTMSLLNGASVFSDVGINSTGQAGGVSITASEALLFSGTSPTIPGSRSGVSATTGGPGTAGDLFLSAPVLDLDGGVVVASTEAGTGNAGTITLDVGHLSITDGGNIQVRSLGPGNGGFLELTADSIAIDGSAVVGVRTGLFSEAEGDGHGGDMVVIADRIDLDGGAQISATSKGNGNAGNIDLLIGDSMYLKDSAVRTEADLAAGGNVFIEIVDTLFLQNSGITASAGGVSPGDDGGNVTVGMPRFLMLNRGEILARANAGNGGNITLAADWFIPSADSVIDASSEQGLDGQIVIDSPNEVTGTVAVLETPAFDLADLLRERCAAAAFRERSSFTVEGSGGLPPAPGEYSPSPLPEESTPSGKARDEVEP